MKAGRFDAIGPRRSRAAAALFACALAAIPVATPAATEPSRPKILTCKDAQGRPIITDPSDPRCYQPPPTEPVRAAREEDLRKRQEAYLACRARQRSLQSLLSRYPDRAKHDAARQGALSQVETSMRGADRRMAELLARRKRLLEEAEFYPSGNLPAQLRRDLDANQASIAAQTLTTADLREEADRKNAFYDAELATLDKLWRAGPGAISSCPAPAD